MATAARAQTRRKAPPRFEQFFAIRRFQPALQFTPDGRKLLFVADISGQFNLWRVRVAGGWPEQLTTFDDRSVRTVAVSPDGRTTVFTADRHGDEFHQIYAVDSRGGWPEAWTDAPAVQHFAGPSGWTRDGSLLAFSANAERPADMDVWVRETATGEIRKVFGRETYSFPAGWSPDGRHLLVVDVLSNRDIRLHLAAADGTEARALTPYDGRARFLPGPWAADGSGFWMVSDAEREYLGLAFYRLEDGSWDWVETPEGDVEDVAASDDGRVLAWIVNERGYARLHLRDVERGEDLPEPQLPPGCTAAVGAALAVSPDGRRAALLWASARRSAELFVVETATGRARRVSDSMVGGLRERDLAEETAVTYPTFDGRDVPAWLYRPRRRGRAPVVVSFHGGPEAQERPWYQPFYQYLVSRGIAVVAPNIRGSTGYGTTYQDLIRRDWGGGDLRDMEHAALWVREQEWANPDRIGVFGGSYGGFATLSCVSRLPEYWAAGVDVVGPSNLVTFAAAVPPSWRRLVDREIGNPETDRAFLLERSPITYVEQVRAPLLVIQGANDPRVVQGESDQMVERLRELGREVEYHVFEDEGHGFTKRTNQLRAYRLAADWFEKHLL